MSGSIEIRSSSDGASWTLEGIATTYGQPYEVNEPGAHYMERLAPGAFTRALSGQDVVELRVEHSPVAPPLAATGRSGTMTLSDSAEGLRLRAELPKDDPDCAAVVSKAKRGLLDRMSIGFRPLQGGDDWSADRSMRTVRAAFLREVSLVTAGMNPHAQVTAVRADGADGGVLELRTMGGLVFMDEQRAGRYTQAEIDMLGGKGLAFLNPDGHYSYPIADRADVLAAIHALGRSGLADKRPLRKWIISRATALGIKRLIPATWNNDGSTKSGRAAAAVTALQYRTLDELELELLALRSPGRAPIRPAPRSARHDPATVRLMQESQRLEQQWAALR
jgi:HK97 family phage prohead protease